MGRKSRQKRKPAREPLRFERVTVPAAEVERGVREAIADFHRRPGPYVALGINGPRDVEEMVRRDSEVCETWVNEIYSVALYRNDAPPPGWPPMIHLSIKRNDREPIHDWRELQGIKNALVGPEHEGVELYPAEGRKVDTANQYHLWVLANSADCFPFGFATRAVSDDTGETRAKQRPGSGKSPFGA